MEGFLLIVKTKLYIPQARRALVERPQLMRKLDEGLRLKLTLLSASAGYGKTTLLSEWARQCGVPVAWLSLDPQDHEWIPFWSSVTASIQAQWSDYGRTIWPLLERGPSTTFATPDVAISAMLNELHQQETELVLILDDYQVIELSTIHQSLSYLLEHLPPNIHLYIASRVEGSFPIARLLAKGEVQRLSVQELRFCPEESLNFFRDTTDLALSGEQMETLYQQTEGWVSGLQLAALTLRSSSNIGESIRQFSGHQHHIADYLLEEVFRQLPEEIQSFLLRTSVLGQMNHALCQAVTEQPNSQQQLEQLEKKNLFIASLDDRRLWYRYHPLLSDFLRQMFARTAPADWRETQLRAARWMEAQGFVEEAAEHYLEGQGYEDVVRILERHLPSFLQQKFTTLSRWILQLPEPFRSRRPMVEMFYLLLLIGIRQWEQAAAEIEQIRVRYEEMRHRMEEAEWQDVMGNMYFLCATASYFQKDLERVSAYFEQTEQYTPDGSFFQMIGENRYSGYEEFEDHLSFINDYHGAAAFLVQWTTRWAHRKEHPFAGRLHASYIKLLYEWNRLEEAERAMRQVIRDYGELPNSRSLLQIYLIASRLEQTLGHAERAAELLELLKTRIESPDYALFLRRIEAEQAVLALRQGQVQPAIEWAARCGIDPRAEVSLNRVSETLTFVRVLAVSGRAEAALALSASLEQLFRREDRLRDRIRVVILQSLMLYRSDRTREALDRLEEALRLAQPQGFIRSFVDEGADLMALLRLALNEQPAILESNPQAGASADIRDAYILQLLQAFGTSQEWIERRPVKESSLGKASSVKGLTQREIEIVRLMAEGCSNKQIAARLHITEGTVKSHAINIYGKLGVHTRVQAIQQVRKLENLD